MKNTKEPEYPSLYDPRSKTGKYHPCDEEYKKKMEIWQKWYDNKIQNENLLN
jgi:hypothetical protein